MVSESVSAERCMNTGSQACLVFFFGGEGMYGGKEANQWKANQWKHCVIDNYSASEPPGTS